MTAYVIDKKNNTLSLEDVLVTMSKDELTKIRKNIGIKNVSKLNREQLKDALVEQMPLALNEALPVIFALFDEERIELLQKIVRKNGRLLIAEPLTEQQQRYWKELGLLFQVEEEDYAFLYMPFEIIDVVKLKLSETDSKLLNINSQLINAVKGIIYYYGAISYSDLENVIKRYAIFNSLKYEVKDIIINYRHYHADFGLNEQYLYHASIPDPKVIIAEQQKREDLDYAHYHLTDLLKVKSAFYIERTSAHQYVVDILVSHYQLQQHEAVLVADQCEFGIRAGLQLNDIIQYMLRELYVENEAQLNILVPRLIIMFNQTSQWFLKGHCSNELKTGASQEQTQVTAAPTNIGRNDQCYCGSGKKYKKCCMNK